VTREGDTDDHGQRFLEPLNLGSSELVSVNQLVDIVEEIGGVKLKTELKHPKE
jgi:hypothetical protein